MIPLDATILSLYRMASFDHIAQTPLHSLNILFWAYSLGTVFGCLTDHKLHCRPTILPIDAMNAATDIGAILYIKNVNWCLQDTTAVWCGLEIGLLSLRLSVSQGGSWRHSAYTSMPIDKLILQVDRWRACWERQNFCLTWNNVRLCLSGQCTEWWVWAVVN